jgi:uncharacterized protein (DUF427 family)
MKRKPDSIIEPGPGQESVWDYPRPPVVAPDQRLVKVIFAGLQIAWSRHAVRVLETSHPPAFYIPPGDVLCEHFQRSGHKTFCEFKGQAIYFNIQVGDRITENAAWCYPDPRPGYETISGYLSFYPARVDRCTVADEVVTPQTGGFYGGWITSEIVGPFKGEAGTRGW